MKHKGLWIGLGIAAVIFALGVIVVGSFGFGYWDFTNDANKNENAIKAQYTVNQNVYDNGVKKVLEVADVPQMYAEAISKVAKDAIQGRYGANGSQAVFQTLQEQNPKLEPGMFVKIQQVVEEFRLEFQQNQNDLISRWQVYNNMLTGTRRGTFYNAIAGAVGTKFPRIDPTKFGIVTSGRTENAFETKKDERIQLHKEVPPAIPSTPTTAAPASPKKAIPPVLIGVPVGQPFKTQ